MSLFASELLKLRTTRSPWVLLGAAALLSGLVAAGIVGSGSADAGEDRALQLAQPAAFFSLLATIVGILVIANEYRHGTVMTTFLTTPRRTKVLGAKLATSLVAGLAIGIASTVVVAGVALPWLAVRGHGLELDLQVLEAIGRVLVAFALAAALGVAVGAIFQNQVGSIIAVFVWFLVVEGIVTVLSGLLFTEIGEPDPVTPYLPGSALGGIVGGAEGADFMLAGGWAVLLSLGYIAALALVGALSMERRDP